MSLRLSGSGTRRGGRRPDLAYPASPAWFVHAEAGHTWRAAWRPLVAVQFDVASGEDRGTTLTRFDPLFGMRRGDLAPAGLYNAVARTNLIECGPKLEWSPGKCTDAFIAYKALWLQSPTDSFSASGVRDVSGRAGDFAGSQVDARVRHWLMPGRLRLELDLVGLIKGRFLRDASNVSSRRDTLYGSLNLTAAF